MLEPNTSLNHGLGGYTKVWQRFYCGYKRHVAIEASDHYKKAQTPTLGVGLKDQRLHFSG